MAQINLLKQKTSVETIWRTAASVLVKLLMVLVLALVAYYVWQFVKISKIDSQTTAAQQDIAVAEKTVGGIINRDELYTRQAQLKQESALITGHLYWSNLFKPLTDATLKQSSYTSIKVTKEGQLTLDVTVPDLLALDKYIQVFDQREFNVNFNNLQIGAFQKTSNNGQTAYSFEARLNFNPSLLHYMPTGATGQ